MRDRGGGSGAQKLDKLERTVRIPEELWVEHVHRNSDVYSSVPNFMDRFRVVNENNSSDLVVDLHFQQPQNVPQILNIVLPQYEKGSILWVVTGTGHHRSGHAAAGVLFKATREYLNSCNLKFDIGKDGNGYNGAFKVYL